MGSFQEDAPFQTSHASFKRGARVADDEEEEQLPVDDQLKAGRAGSFGPRSRAGSSVTDISSGSASMNYGKSSSRQDKIGSDSFWCGAFCMHLPGLSRRRPIMQQQQSMSLSEPDALASTAAGPAAEAAANSAVSKAASMERFGNSSSSASGMVLDGRVGEEEEDDQEVSAYFDLSLELLRSSSVDMESPVTAAFLFDSSRGRGGKKSLLPDNLDFSFPSPPAFSSPSSPPS
uniref:Uncharacterized protein n=1 Tax=Avena sativa TaxID=4498 RepID=A0ACD5VT78_AVESA